MSARAVFAVSGQGAGPLTPRQKRVLVLEARRAYEVQRSVGMAEESFEVWRHGAVADVVPGATGLSALCQADFAPVRDYLRRLAGADRAGSAEALRAADELRRARWTLERECRRLGEAFEGGEAGARRYAESIVRARCGAAQETAEQVWQAVFTLRARARKRAQSASGTRDGENHPQAARRVFPYLSRDGIGI